MNSKSADTNIANNNFELVNPSKILLVSGSAAITLPKIKIHSFCIEIKDGWNELAS